MSSPNAALASRLAPAKRGFQLVLGVDEPHPAPAPAGRGLQHHRVAEPRGGRLRLGHRRASPGRSVAVVARDHRDAGRLHERPRRRLAPHRPHRRRRRPDEGGARRRDRLGEVGVLRQEPVPGMDRVGARLPERVDDLLGDEVALARRRRADRHRLVGHADVHRRPIGLRMDRHRAKAELAAGADHPAGDLAPVGDQDLGDSARRHGRQYPAGALGLRGSAPASIPASVRTSTLTVPMWGKTFSLWPRLPRPSVTSRGISGSTASSSGDHWS